MFLFVDILSYLVFRHGFVTTGAIWKRVNMIEDNNFISERDSGREEGILARHQCMKDDFFKLLLLLFPHMSPIS